MCLTPAMVIRTSLDTNNRLCLRPALGHNNRLRLSLLCVSPSRLF